MKTETTENQTSALDQIAQQAAQDELLNPQPDQVTETGGPVIQVDYQADAADCVDFAIESFSGIWPKLETVYTQDRKNKISKAVGRLFERYQLSLDGVIGNPWVGLAIALTPVVVPTYRIVTESEQQPEALAPVTPMQPIIPVTDENSLHNRA